MFLRCIVRTLTMYAAVFTLKLISLHAVYQLVGLTAVCGLIEIVQVTSQCDFSPFVNLHSVDLATRRRYCSRQLNVLLSSNALLKGTIALFSACAFVFKIAQKVKNHF